METIELAPFYTIDKGTYEEHYLSLYELLLSFEGQTTKSLSILN